MTRPPPTRSVPYAREAADRGLKVIIAGAGGAAPARHGRLDDHAAGHRCARSAREARRARFPPLDRADAGGHPGVHLVGGAKNAGILAARILGASDPAVRARLDAYARELTSLVERNAALKARVAGESGR